MSDSPSKNNSNTEKSGSIDEDRIKPRPIKRNCSQEEYQRVVDGLMQNLKPYELDLLAKIRSFSEDKGLTILEFPSSLSGNERQVVHYLADIFGLSHESQGKGKQRYIRCEKIKSKENEIVSTTAFTEQYYYKGYISLMGPYVDSCANQSVKDVPAPCIEARMRRDGPRHHITILSRAEVDSLVDEMKKSPNTKSDTKFKNGEDVLAHLLGKLATDVNDSWTDVGLGKVRSNKQKPDKENEEPNEAYFKVVKWDDANKFRQSLGLPEKDFHITIGFKTEDIHDVPKDISTLISQFDNVKI